MLASRSTIDLQLPHVCGMSNLKGHKGSVLCLHRCDQQVLLSGGEVRPETEQLLF